MKQWIVVLSLFAAALCMPRAEAAEVMTAIASHPICYMSMESVRLGRIEDVETSSKETEVLRITYGAGFPVQSTAARAQTRAQIEPLVITKMVSATTPKLFQILLTGDQIKQAMINCVRPDREGKLAVYYALKLQDAIISNIHQFSDGTRFLEDVSITAGRFETIYTPAGKASSAFRFDTKAGR